MEQGSNKKEEKQGTVIEALPKTLFRVRYEDGRENIAYLAGRMRQNRIRVLVGDRVTVELNPYGDQDKIVRRL